MLTLTAGDIQVVVVPEIGGSLQRLSVGPTDILRRGRPDHGSALHMASFPLVPWCNRIVDGTFIWEGRPVDVGPSPELGEPHGLHGHGWRWRWDVLETDEGSTVLGFLHPAGRWPWRYRAEQAIVVETDRVTTTLGVENLSDSPMPVALGFHPWFERPARFTANVDGQWVGDDVIPNRWAEAEAFRGFDVDHREYDNTFTGWDGRAMIDLSDVRVQLTSDLDKLHVFTPKGRGHFALEPTGGSPAALNHPDRESLALLEPGARTERFMRISIA